MNELRKIGDLAEQYAVSGRTLRYYEEIGLISSTRQGSAGYRYYDQAAVRRLEQILVLRRLDFSIGEIRQVFDARDGAAVLAVFSRKLMAVEAGIRVREDLRAAIAKLLALLRDRAGDQADSLAQLVAEAVGPELRVSNRVTPKEMIRMEAKVPMSDGISPSEVRVITLKPLRVAWYRAESASPEMDAWNVLLPWLEARGLDRLPTTRYFGFNNPNPSADSPVYGYEVWVTLPEGVAGEAEVGVKEFPGGDYAVISTYLHEITERWHSLGQWTEANGYTIGSHQCLEETISPVRAPAEQMQLDLYCPIRR